MRMGVRLRGSLRAASRPSSPWLVGLPTGREAPSSSMQCSTTFWVEQVSTSCPEVRRQRCGPASAPRPGQQPARPQMRAAAQQRHRRAHAMGPPAHGPRGTRRERRGVTGHRRDRSLAARARRARARAVGRGRPTRAAHALAVSGPIVAAGPPGTYLVGAKDLDVRRCGDGRWPPAHERGTLPSLSSIRDGGPRSPLSSVRSGSTRRDWRGVRAEPATDLGEADWARFTSANDRVGVVIAGHEGLRADERVPKRQAIVGA